MKKYKVIVIGAGSRGDSYARNMKLLADKFEVVGVADPIPERCENIKKMFELSEEECYSDWERILEQPRFADIAIIATMDDMHYEVALKAIDKGYHLLLEKPVAQTVEECVAIAQAAEKKGVQVLVCHVLRYTPFYKKVKELVMSGAIGDIQSLIQVEAVGNVHQSHSYVRGDWHRAEETTPMILAKCCHDLDIIQWLIDKPCEKVSSFGDLSYFIPKNAPEGAPKRCIDGGCPVEEHCPYECKQVYLGERSYDWMRRNVARGFSKEFVPTDQEVLEGLKNTNFGACVYHAGNNVVDHQVVNMQFEGGATASLTMNAFNKGGRYIRIFGTRGELFANASDTEIQMFSFDDRTWKTFSVEKTEESIAGGHGGGDYGIVVELYDYLSGNYTGYCVADIATSVKNHLIGFAAEKARHNDTVENLVEFGSEYGYKYKD
jgi:predicted dehydrogenase